MIYMMRFTLSLAACSHSRTSSLAGSFFLFILYLFTPHINATQQDDICWLAAAWLLVLVVIILAHLSFFYFIFFFFFNFFLFQPIKRESFDDCMRLKSFFTLLDVDKRQTTTTMRMTTTRGGHSHSKHTVQALELARQTRKLSTHEKNIIINIFIHDDDETVLTTTSWQSILPR